MAILLLFPVPTNLYLLQSLWNAAPGEGAPGLSGEAELFKSLALTDHLPCLRFVLSLRDCLEGLTLFSHD